MLDNEVTYLKNKNVLTRLINKSWSTEMWIQMSGNEKLKPQPSTQFFC